MSEETNKERGAADERSMLLAFVLPLVISLVITSFYPSFAESYQGDGWDEETVVKEITPETWTYLAMVTGQVILVSAALFYFWKIYLRQFPFRVSPWSVVVGVLGVVLWVWMTGIGIEHQVLSWLGFDMGRAAFNPFVLNNSAVLIGFFVVRFILMSLVNPIAEELFVRGWLIRWIDNPDFYQVKLTDLTMLGLLGASFYGVLTHPTEAIAAFIWFGLVTLLMKYTGSIWDCIVAHVVTNFLLGVYVVYYQQWQLW